MGISFRGLPARKLDNGKKRVMKMYVYKVGWGSYEESEYTELYHDQRFTDEDLEKMVFDAVINVLSEIVKSDFDKICLREDGIAYEEIHSKVVTVLQEKHGFTKVQYQASWSIFGWPSLTDKNSWRGQRDEPLDRLYESIPKDVRDAINEMGSNRRKKDMGEEV